MTSSEIIAKYGLPEGTEASDPKDYLVGAEPMSDTKRFDLRFPAVPQPSESFLGRGVQSLERGVVQGKDIAGGLTMMAGEAVGSDSLKTAGEDMTINAKRFSVENQSPVPSYSDIHGVGDFFEYATSSILEMLPLNAALLATGVGGAGIAGKLATGSFRGAITREMAAALTDEMVQKHGLEGAKELLAKVVAKDTASKAAQQVGARVGVGLGSSAVETGSDASQINAETGHTGGWTTLALGIAGGATDMFGGESQALTSVLGGRKAGVGSAFMHVAKEIGKTEAHEIPQELVQNTLSQTALQLQTPNKNQFGEQFLHEQIDTIGKTVFGTIPMGGVSGLATLPPSKNPITRVQENDIKYRAHEINPNEEDKALAEDLAKESTGEGISSALGKEKGSDTGEGLKTLTEQLVIANDKHKAINDELGKLVMEDDPSKETLIADLQIQKKDAFDEVKAIQSQIAGFDPETGTKNGKRPASDASPFFEVGLPTPNHEEARTWLNKAIPKTKDPVKVGAFATIRNALTPFASMLHAFDITPTFVDTNPDAPTQKSQIFADDDGNIRLQINTKQAERLAPARYAKELEEEVFHIATVLHDRKTWVEAARPMGFKEWAKNQSTVRADEIRKNTGDTALRTFAKTYGLRGDLFDVKGKDAKGVEKANRDLDREFTRAVLQKLRTGEITEDLKWLEKAEKDGNESAGKFFNNILDALKRIKDVLITYINPKTAPKNTKALVDGANHILNRYESRLEKTKAKPVKGSEKPSGVSTPKTQQKPTTGNVEPTEGKPEKPKSKEKPKKQEPIVNDKSKTPLERAAEEDAIRVEKEKKGGLTGEWKPVAEDEPAVPDGHVRFYHAGQDVGKGESRWLAPNRDWVKGFRKGLPVHYVDIPTGDPQLKKSYDDSGISQPAPYVKFEADEATTARLKKLPEKGNKPKPRAKREPMSEKYISDVKRSLAGVVTDDPSIRESFEKAVGAKLTDDQILDIAVEITKQSEARGVKAHIQDSLYSQNAPTIRDAWEAIPKKVNKRFGSTYVERARKTAANILASESGEEIRRRLESQVGEKLTDENIIDIAVEFMQRQKEAGNPALIADGLSEQPDFAIEAAWSAVSSKDSAASSGEEAPNTSAEQTSFALPKGAYGSKDKTTGVVEGGVGKGSFKLFRTGPHELVLTSPQIPKTKVSISSQQELDDVISHIKDQARDIKEPMNVYTSGLHSFVEEHGFKAGLVEMIHRLYGRMLKDRLNREYYGSYKQEPSQLTLSALLGNITEGTSIAPDEMNQSKISTYSERESKYLEGMKHLRSDQEKKNIATARLKKVLDELVAEGKLSTVTGLGSTQATLSQGTLNYYPTEENESAINEEIKADLKAEKNPVRYPDPTNESIPVKPASEVIGNDNPVASAGREAAFDDVTILLKDGQKINGFHSKELGFMTEEGDDISMSDVDKWGYDHNNDLSGPKASEIADQTEADRYENSKQKSDTERFNELTRFLRHYAFQRQQKAPTDYNRWRLNVKVNLDNVVGFIDRETPKYDVADKIKQEMLDNNSKRPAGTDRLIKATDFHNISEVKQLQKKLNELLDYEVQVKVRPSDIEKFKKEYPDEYAELKAMRMDALLRAGYSVEGWHGTDAEFSEFDPSRNVNKADGNGIFFAPKKNGVAASRGKKIISAMLRINRPSRAGVYGPSWMEFSENPQNDGYDASIYYKHDTEDAFDEDAIENIKVFNPSQIKSTEPLALDKDGELITPDQWGDSSSDSIANAGEEIDINDIVSGKILHTLRNADDLTSVLNNGLRAGTNVTMDGGKPNQSLGDGVTLVFNKKDVRADDKGYNPNDGIVSSRSKAKPTAVLIERDVIDSMVSKTFTMDEIGSKLDDLYNRLEALREKNKTMPEGEVTKDGETFTFRWTPEASVEQKFDGRWITRYRADQGIPSWVVDGMPKFPQKEYGGRGAGERNLERQIDEWHNRFSALLDAQDADPSITKLPETSEEDAIKEATKNIPKDIPVFTYEMDENDNAINVRRAVIANDNIASSGMEISVDEATKSLEESANHDIDFYESMGDGRTVTDAQRKKLVKAYIESAKLQVELTDFYDRKSKSGKSLMEMTQEVKNEQAEISKKFSYHNDLAQLLNAEATFQDFTPIPDMVLDDKEKLYQDISKKNQREVEKQIKELGGRDAIGRELLTPEEIKDLKKRYKDLELQWKALNDRRTNDFNEEKRLNDWGGDINWMAKEAGHPDFVGYMNEASESQLDAARVLVNNDRKSNIASSGVEIADAFNESFPDVEEPTQEAQDAIIKEFNEKGRAAFRNEDGTVKAIIIRANAGEIANGSKPIKLISFVSGEIGNHLPDLRFDTVEEAAYTAAKKQLHENTTRPTTRISQREQGQPDTGSAEGTGASGGEGQEASSGREIPEYESNLTNLIRGQVRGASNILKSTGTETGKYRKSKMSVPLGENNPHLNNLSRAHWVSFDNTDAFLKRNEFFGALRKIANGSVSGMHEADQHTLAGILNQNFEAAQDSIKYDSGLSYEEMKAPLAELDTLMDKLGKRMAEKTKEHGQGISVLRAIKKFFYNGTSLARDSRRLLFNAAEAIESAMGFGNIDMIHEAVLNAMPKAVDEAFTSKELMAKLAHLTRSMIENPDRLLKGIKDGIKTRKAGWAAAMKAVSRAGNEILKEGGKDHIDALVKRIALRIDQTAPEKGKIKSNDIINQTLSKFADDFFPREKTTSVKDQNKKTKLLAAIIANDNLKNKFVTALENKLAEKYLGGRNSEGFRRDYEGVFDEMREANWSEGIRNAAIEELKRNMGVTVGKMLTKGGWDVERGKLAQALRDALPMATKEQIDQLITDANKHLDEQAERHLENTFGFKKNEDGTFDLTKSGNLKGGDNIKRVLKELHTTLRDITKMSLSSREAITDKLATEAINMTGMPADMALKFQQAFANEIGKATEWTRDKEIAKKIQQVTDKLNDKKNIPVTKSVIDKIVEMANQGFLSHEKIYDAIRQQYKNSKLPAFDPKLAEMIQQYGNEMDLLPDGVLKDRIRQQIANEVANATPLTARDAITSYWYFSLLSGPSTWLMANPIGNAANLFATASAMAVDNPKAGIRIYARIFKEIISPDSTSWNKFRYTMHSGMVPIEMSAKYGSGMLKKGTITEVASLPVERITKASATTMWTKFLYRLSRGLEIGNFSFGARTLSRFMSATDMFFRQAGYMAALEYQNVSISKEMVDAARKEAADEIGGEDKALINVRADEIIRTKLLESNPYELDRAEHIGLEVSFNQRPKGMIGSLASYLGELGNKYPAVKILVPFTNIVANVWNESLNFGPVGFSRWAMAKWGGSKEWTIVDDKGNDIADSLQLKKAMLGMGLMTLMAYAFGGGDDKDFELVGNGPKDKRERQMFFDRGMRPYTMRFGKTVIGYQALGPLASSLGAIGTFLDLKRSNKGKKQGVMDSFQSVMFSGMAALVTSQLSQSFFSSASNMFQAMYSPSAGSGLQRWVAGQVGTVVPNLIRQINNEWIDNGIYRSGTFQGQVLQSMGVTKSIGGLPVLNAYGDPVKRMMAPVVGRLVSFSNADPTMSELRNLGLSIPIGSDRINNVEMTDQQKYDFRSQAGPLLRQAHNALIPTLKRMVNSGDIEGAQNLLDDATSKVSRSVKTRMIHNLRH